jgi:hypothetical protein
MDELVSFVIKFIYMLKYYLNTTSHQIKGITFKIYAKILYIN